MAQSISALSLGPLGWVQHALFFLPGFALLSTAPVWQRVLFLVYVLPSLFGLVALYSAWPS